MWGFGLKLDPDYPKITRFLPNHVTDTVFEYRSYGLVALWALLLALITVHGFWMLFAAFLTFWIFTSTERALLYRSELAWWRQAWRESPCKTRTLLGYSEVAMTRANYLYTVGGRPWEDPEIQRLMHDVLLIQEVLSASKSH